MAKLMNYYVPSMGIEVEDVYWIPSRVDVNKRENHVYLELTGYRDRESRVDGINIIDTKVWDLWGDEARDFITGLIMCDYNAIRYIYEWVTNKRDIMLNGARVSFFEGATDVFEEEENNGNEPQAQGEADTEAEAEVDSGTETDVGSNEGSESETNLSEVEMIPGGDPAPIDEETEETEEEAEPTN